MKKRYRGHGIEWTGHKWTYTNFTPELARYGKERPCTKCGKVSSGPDSCLGKLPGVKAACCGHGVDEDAYITFDNGLTVQGRKAIRLKECWTHTATDPGTAIEIYRRLGDVEATYKLCKAGDRGIRKDRLIDAAIILEMLVRKSVDVAGIGADLEANKRSCRDFT